MRFAVLAALYLALAVFNIWIGLDQHNVLSTLNYLCAVILCALALAQFWLWRMHERTQRLRAENDRIENLIREGRENWPWN